MSPFTPGDLTRRVTRISEDSAGPDTGMKAHGTSDRLDENGGDELSDCVSEMRPMLIQ